MLSYSTDMIMHSMGLIVSNKKNKEKIATAAEATPRIPLALASASAVLRLLVVLDQDRVLRLFRAQISPGRKGELGVRERRGQVHSPCPRLRALQEARGGWWVLCSIGL